MTSPDRKVRKVKMSKCRIIAWCFVIRRIHHKAGLTDKSRDQSSFLQKFTQSDDSSTQVSKTRDILCPSSWIKNSSFITRFLDTRRWDNPSFEHMSFEQTREITRVLDTSVYNQRRSFESSSEPWYKETFVCRKICTTEDFRRTLNFSFFMEAPPPSHFHPQVDMIKERVKILVKKTMISPHPTHSWKKRNNVYSLVHIPSTLDHTLVYSTSFHCVPCGGYMCV